MFPGSEPPAQFTQGPPKVTLSLPDFPVKWPTVSIVLLLHTRPSGWSERPPRGGGGSRKCGVTSREGGGAVGNGLSQALPGAVQWDSLTEMDLSWNFVGRVGVLPVLEVCARDAGVPVRCARDVWV